LILGVANLALNLILDLLLYKPLGPGGITLSTSLVSTFNFLGLMYLLRRQIGGVDGRRVVRSALSSVLALLPLAAAGHAAWRIVEAVLGDSTPAQLVAVSAGYAAGLGAYVLMARLLGMQELGQVIGVLRRRREPRDVPESAPPEDREPA
jgi:putative peptidoglycan lipid II flippase